MSAESLGTSSGDSAVQPPTPKRTPTPPVFSSPVLETPKQGQGRLDESSGWTPRFAEEYSVFNSTPGNLRGSRTPFLDFGPPTPYSSGTGQKRSLSTDGIGLGVAVHVSEVSPNLGLSLPPVEPSKVLRSSPTPQRSRTFDSSIAASESPGSVEQSAKKARRGTIVTEPQGQAVTPPPSARKGERKLAPKLGTAAMQNDQDYGQQAHFMASTQQQGMGNFVTTQSDMFSYHLSASTGGTPYGAQRPFWDADPGLAGMEIDFSANGAGVFQPPTPHQVAGPVDWPRTSHLLPDQNSMAGHSDVSAGGHQAALGTQPPMSMLVTSSADQSMFAGSYPTPIDDPFGISDAGGAVNPGLLFSRPQSANMDASFTQPLPVSNPNPAMAHSSQADSRAPSASNNAGRAELRRSVSAKDATPRKQDRISASSPIKEAGRPGLSRSFSENRGKKTVSRPSLPPLAPRPRSQLVSNAGVNANKPVISQSQRPSGRSSPSKSVHHHHRLSSLSSIPETSGPEMRTKATFMIDANGRARVETTVVVVEEPSPSVAKRHSSYSVTSRQQWDSSDDDSSSTDDEPIIIPSRNASFALPDPRKPTTIHPFHNSQRSISERSNRSYTSSQGPSQEAGDSDGETVVNELTPTRKASGDALSELRKLRETWQKQSSSRPKRLGSSHYPGHPPTSPTTMSESSLPTPTTDTRARAVHCVCNRTGASRNELLIQCQSCEMYVHGQCVSITEQTIPSIYICAFCANTPNMRGGRLRDNGRLSGTAGAGAPGSVTSPLAHKSLKSFR
ncbi:hypothetical protein C7999DRAFT_40994 [Corynascus novoguineensis]|uniref:PHD-type domain-containing protein n=1 Tax=Corynascus novoguineensis TaxID=1126955 RepID=A0AAN7CTQ9_9PEZI|nr:hypothetical protein C7999DRAFT_40994 [Corynascus novoguineensis]